MARLDRETAAVFACDALLFMILAACIAALVSLPEQAPDSTPRGGFEGGHAEPAPWPEPADGTYAR